MYKDGDKVWVRMYSGDVQQVVGIVRGQATLEMPVIGRMWIVESDHFKSDTYPFRFASIPGCALHLVKE